ncbi:methyltransferase domain-containing protein [Ruegeria denitrificans]|uniref:methyltransferase domain-containing protein n=1 Tax=Ruegeria denitrificans TaxID=1715692 RepID=UPI00071CB953|nr:methyltransferase domain-containing protein [Ruegeria denitrificans]
MLKFDAETTRLLEIAYQGAELTRRRQASFDALRPAPGETILDVGCGNGMLTAELARAVGSDGYVIGIDPSEDMTAAARERCSDYANVEFRAGAANSLPIEDESADKAVSVQVFEYIEDVDGALSDTLRCVKPGGRLVISDLHFGSLIWFSDEPDRMQKMLTSWNQHFVSGSVPERLPALIKARGDHVEDVLSFTMTDHQLRPDGLAIMMMHLMKQYTVANDHVDPAVAQLWFDEQLSLARTGRFFFSMTQFVVVVRKKG